MLTCNSTVHQPHLHAVQPTTCCTAHQCSPAALVRPPICGAQHTQQNHHHHHRTTTTKTKPGGRWHTHRQLTWHQQPSQLLRCAISKLAIYHASCCCTTQKPAACPGLSSKLMTADELQQVCTENTWISTTQISNRTRSKGTIESTASVYLNPTLHSCTPKSSMTGVARSQRTPKERILITHSNQNHPQRQYAPRPNQPDKTVLSTRDRRQR